MKTTKEHIPGPRRQYLVKVFLRGVCLGGWCPDTKEEAQAIIENVKETPQYKADTVLLAELKEGEPYKDERYGGAEVKEVWRETTTYARYGEQWAAFTSKDFLPPELVEKLKEYPY